MTKCELEKIMLPEIDDIVSTWDNDGIIIETQFDFAYQFMFKKYIDIAYQIIVEHDGHEIEAFTEDDSEHAHPHCVAPFCKNEGYMYCFFDPNYMSCAQAERKVINYINRYRST